MTRERRWKVRRGARRLGSLHGRPGTLTEGADLFTRDRSQLLLGPGIGPHRRTRPPPSLVISSLHEFPPDPHPQDRLSHPGIPLHRSSIHGGRSAVDAGDSVRRLDGGAGAVSVGAADRVCSGSLRPSLCQRRRRRDVATALWSAHRAGDRRHVRGSRGPVDGVCPGVRAHSLSHAGRRPPLGADQRGSAARFRARPGPRGAARPLRRHDFGALSVARRRRQLELAGVRKHARPHRRDRSQRQRHIPRGDRRSVRRRNSRRLEEHGPWRDLGGDLSPPLRIQPRQSDDCLRSGAPGQCLSLFLPAFVLAAAGVPQHRRRHDLDAPPGGDRNPRSPCPAERDPRRRRRFRDRAEQ